MSGDDARTITIYYSTEGGFSIIEGDTVADCLTWDEMLGQIAAMTMPGRFRQSANLFAKDVDGMLAEMERRAKLRREKETGDRPVLHGYRV